MGNSIPEETVIEKCLKILDVALYRHPYRDHGSKKLLTGKAILLLVDAQLRQYDSLWEISENLRAKKALQQLTQLDSIHESTIHRKLEDLPTEVLQELCASIFEEIHGKYREKKGLSSLGKLHIIDASKIVLPKKVGEWAYCTKHENSIKIHLRYIVADEKTAYPDHFVLSTGAVSDQEGAVELVVDANATYVLDRGYINYSNYLSWTKDNIPFVARVQARSKLKVLEERAVPTDSPIIRDADVEVKVPKTEETFILRLVEYNDDEGTLYRVVTNRWDISAYEVSEIYRHRWKIELFFKWIKQHLNIVKLYNRKPEAVWNQIYIAMIAYGLCELIKIQTGTTKTTWEVLKTLRIYWFDSWEQFLNALNREPSRTSKGRKKKGKPGRPRKHPRKLKAVKFMVK
jgi:hypothetical protein